MSRKSFIPIVAFVLLCTVTAAAYEKQDLVGEYYIPIGIPVIDGVISPGEWDHANWLQLDKLYYGDPPDLSDASWAALWSPETNLIYVVVTGTDTVHVFGDGYWSDTAWNDYDMAEVYFDPSNSDISPYQQIQDPAQQWMGANNTTGGRWIMLPVEHVYPDNVLPDELRPEFFSTVVGDLYTYEFALTPYEAFGWNTGRANKILQLETDMRVGVDVIMSSKSTSYGMLCENAWEADDDIDGDGIDDGIITIGKWKGAERFLDHSLVNDPNQAWRPRPGNRAADASSEVTLKWNAGKNAASHNIYFGSSFNDVNDATDPDLLPVGRSNKPLEENTYQPTEVPLALGETYYWRIDEVNGTDVTKGNIWRFTVTNYLIVDDFDSYVPYTDPIEDTWSDYRADDNVTRAELFLETAIVRDGNSMQYEYSNIFSPYYCESEAQIDNLQVTSDWTEYDVKGLTLWFYGTGDNDAEQMYLALEDNSGNLAVIPYDGDANDLKAPIWQQWNIVLQDFNDVNNVDLSSIASIYIGFGDRYNRQPGGSGIVYFDDIRLYLQRCITEYVEADFSGDCIVNLDDLEILATDWLKSEFWVDYTTPVDELIWYMFDNTGTSSTAVDSSVNGYDGAVSDAVWTTEGYIDGALIFDRDQESSVEVPPEALASVTTQITIALWQFGNPQNQPMDDNLFEATRDYSTTPGIRVLNAHLPWSNSIVYWDAGNPNDVYSDTVFRECDRIEKEAELLEDYAGQWNHWTFTKNCDANDGTGEMKIYLNGFLWHSGYDVNVPLTGTIDDFVIGSGFDASYSGTIDDFRIYNYELSQEQIAYLATVGTGYYPLQQRAANIHEDEVIDFKDYAEMADNWLQELLWP